MKGRNAVDANEAELDLEHLYSSEDFVLSAGALPFLITPGSPLKVCLVHHTRTDEWLLAKGRKDEGESLECAAVREVLEETGYTCHLLPISIPTRATIPASIAGNLYQPDCVRLASQCSEPFAISTRYSKERTGNIKLVFWYIASLDLDSESLTTLGLPGGPGTGTHMEAEGFGKAALFEIDEAMEKLKYEGQREVLRLGVKLLKAGFI